IVIFNRHILAPGVSSLEREAVGELPANRHLQAVVVGIGVKGRSANTNSLITEIRYPEKNIQRCIRRDPVDWVRGAGESCGVVVVILLHQVNGTRTDKTSFQDPLWGKLILNAQVVLPDQGRVNDLVKEWNVKV